MRHEPLTWSAFQSLFQLSVGLNTAISVLYDFFGSTCQRRSIEALRWKERARALENDWNDLLQELSIRPSSEVTPTSEKVTLKRVPEITEILPGQFALLEGDFLRIQDTHESIILDYARWICLAFAASSLVFLMVSSFYAQGRINLGFKVYAIVQYLPFCGALLVITLLAIQVYAKSRDMNKLGIALIDSEKAYFTKLRATKSTLDETN